MHRIADFISIPDIESMVIVRQVRSADGSISQQVMTYGVPPELTPPILEAAAKQIVESEFAESILVRAELQ